MVTNIVRAALAVFPTLLSLALLYYGISVFLGVVPALASEFVG